MLTLLASVAFAADFDVRGADGIALAQALAVRGVASIDANVIVDCNDAVCDVRIARAHTPRIDARVPIANLDGDDAIRAIALAIAGAAEAPAPAPERPPESEPPVWSTSIDAGVGGSTTPRAVLGADLTRHIGPVIVAVGPTAAVSSARPGPARVVPAEDDQAPTRPCLAGIVPGSGLGAHATLAARIGGRWTVDLGATGRLMWTAPVIHSSEGLLPGQAGAGFEGGPLLAVATPGGWGLRASAVVPTYWAWTGQGGMRVAPTAELALTRQFGR